MIRSHIIEVNYDKHYDDLMKTNLIICKFYDIYEIPNEGADFVVMICIQTLNEYIYFFKLNML